MVNDKNAMDEEVVEWFGLTLPDTNESWAWKGKAVADAAKQGCWDSLLSLLGCDPWLVNVPRPGGASGCTPLHYAAHLGAPASVIANLLSFNAFRTVRNAWGDRPVDMARRQNQGTAVMVALEPAIRCKVAFHAIESLQVQFHGLISERAGDLVRQHRLRLPELETMTEFEQGRRFWFSIPGMAGGFHFWLTAAGEDPCIVAESWCRVVDGSGMRHAITTTGSTLIAEGFV